ncbi:MAG: hypothetical protein JXR94_16430 [Candidatus Hydrogenedentes bacterium]|nr:hypothetical protein [Candidatus Hydrogenedentota bacterium]
MIPLVEVICPHCGARGEVMLPLLGAIVIGPCPNCHELVCVFCGRALPLRKDIILEGTPTEKREHILQVLRKFLDERVDELVHQMTHEEVEQIVNDADARDELLMDEPDELFLDEPRVLASPRANGDAITQAEVEDFVKSDLPHIDNRHYFKAIFD